MSIADAEKLWGRPKENMTVEEMKADMLLYIQHYDWVTVAELKRRYEAQATGQVAIEGPIPNVFIYMGLSQVFCDALLGLAKEKLIHTHAAHVLAYMVDGEILRLPLAKRPCPDGYKKPHWLPVCYRPGASCSSKDCPQRVKESEPPLYRRGKRRVTKLTGG